jgi:2-dehydropantoate 2-reductase
MKLAIFGAGAIGGYVGGVLLAARHDVVMIGRPSLGAEIAAHGLSLTDLEGGRAQVAAEHVRYHTDATALGDADIIVVAVKSRATAEAAHAIAAHAKADALIVSFQNGIGNAEQLRAGVGARTVLAAMVPWNVVRLGGGRLHRGSSGVLMIEEHARAQWLATALSAAGLHTNLRADIVSVQWSKVLHNLNNAVNALSGLPLLTQLSDRPYRLCLAAAIEEALNVLAAAGITPAQIAKVPPQKLPRLLRLPNFIYRFIMARTLKIDAQARSSMQDDVRAGQPTEIDELNGAVVRLARLHCRSAPINARMVELVQAATPETHISAAALRRLLHL